MQGKVVVITGGTSGIGQVAAEKLAALGARIVLVARDKQRAEAVMQRLPGPARHSVHYADLSLISGMRRAADEVAAAEPRIDVLINNAGAMFTNRQLTPDGLEKTFAVNHLAYYVLTQGLRERLLASAPSRIVNTSSNAHKGATLDFDDLQTANNYSGFKVYGRSKLCNILFTRELARQLEATGVTANCLHPGFVATRFGDQSGGLLSSAIGFAKFFAISPEKGAETIVYLASSSEANNITGQYFYKCKPAVPTPQARDDASATRLWQETQKLCGAVSSQTSQL